MPKIFPHIVQGSPEWYALRRGRPTTSGFDRIITCKKMELASAHKGYIASLIADSYDSQYPRESASSAATREGTRREPESLKWYAMNTDLDVTPVGCVLTDDGRWGCSPDSLIGDEGALECKNPSPEVHTKYLLEGKLPDDYVQQCFGTLWVTGRKWLEFMSYHPDMPQQFVIRIYPQGPFWEAMSAILEEFHKNYVAAMEKVSKLTLQPGQIPRMLAGLSLYE